VVDPPSGCRVQQTCALSKSSFFGMRTLAEQTVEAGRNGKNGTSLGRGGSRPKFGRRSGRELTQGQYVAEGANR